MLAHRSAKLLFVDNYVILEDQNGQISQIDREDLAKVANGYGFYVGVNDDGPRAYIKLKGQNYLIARLILEPPNDMVVDHINGNTLDNRKSNLRICTYQQNSWNCAPKKTGLLKKQTHGFKGVRLNRSKINPYRARINVNGKDISSKSVATVIEAARLYDELAKKYYGEFARLNFSEDLNEQQRKQKRVN